MCSSTGGRTARRAFNFGRTYVVKPKGKHQATVVWLHGLGDNCSGWSQILETLPLPNIKWICPTAPTQPVSIFGGFPSTASLILGSRMYSFVNKQIFLLLGCDVGDLSEDAPVDSEGMDASAAHVANLLSNEPSDIKLGLGGFSMGAATALYSAVCFSLGEFSNGSPYSANISAVVGLSGWLPDAKNLTNKLQGKAEATRRAAALPILLCHGTGDEVVPHNYGQKSSGILSSAGFQDATFKSYEGLGHFTSPEELNLVCSWFSTKLGLDGSS